MLWAGVYFFLLNVVVGYLFGTSLWWMGPVLVVLSGAALAIASPRIAKWVEEFIDNQN